MQTTGPSTHFPQDASQRALGPDQGAGKKVLDIKDLLEAILLCLPPQRVLVFQSLWQKVILANGQLSESLYLRTVRGGPVAPQEAVDLRGLTPGNNYLWQTVDVDWHQPGDYIDSDLTPNHLPISRISHEWMVHTGKGWGRDLPHWLPYKPRGVFAAPQASWRRMLPDTITNDAAHCRRFHSARPSRQSGRHPCSRHHRCHGAEA